MYKFSTQKHLKELTAIATRLRCLNTLACKVAELSPEETLDYILPAIERLSCEFEYELASDDCYVKTDVVH